MSGYLSENLLDELRDAIENGDSREVRRLLALPSLNASTVVDLEEGTTALMVAVLHERDQLVDLLLKWRADHTARDRNGLTALLHAASLTRTKPMAAMLGLGLRINEATDGMTPLLYAVLLGNKEMVAYLVENGADTSTRVRLDGYDALGIACSLGHLEIVRTLVDQGKADVNAVSGLDAGSPLTHAARGGYTEIVSYLLSLQRQRVRVNHQCSDGNAALHLAVLSGHEPAVRALLARNDLRVSLVNGQGRAAVDLSVQGHLPPQITHLLLNRGADPIGLVEKVVQRGVGYEKATEFGATITSTRLTRSKYPDLTSV